MSETKRVHVVAAVIENSDNEILIAKRPDHLHQGGLWEFPGGKVEQGESPEIALAREIHEEVGIFVHASTPLIQIHHDYPDKSIFLDVFKITNFKGIAHGKEGQQTQWIKTEHLDEFQFPAANLPIIRAAQLPNHYLITPEPDLKQRSKFLDRLESKIAGGFRLVQLRAKNLTSDELFSLYQDAKKIGDKFGATLMVNTNLEHAQKMCLQALHLSSKQLRSCDKVPNKKMIVAASCHNEAEVQKANQLGLDFIVLSPVNQTTSHPHAKPLGWPEFSNLCRVANIPVYALGGMQIDDTFIAQQNGAQGIAAISAFW